MQLTLGFYEIPVPTYLETEGYKEDERRMRPKVRHTEGPVSFHTREVTPRELIALLGIAEDDETLASVYLDPLRRMVIVSTRVVREEAAS